MTAHLKAAALLSALMAAGCATPPLDVPPVLDLAGHECTETPSLAAAVPVVAIIDGKSEKPSTTMLDANSPCLARPAGKALYALFAVPDGGPYTISIASVPLGRSLLAPRASVLDDKGGLVRELPTSSFMFRGTYFTALYRSHAGERYILVESDPPSVGKPLSRVHETVQQTYLSTGYATVVVYTGSDIAMNTTWAHNGEVIVNVVGDKPPK